MTSDRRFTKEFHNWPLNRFPHLNLTYVETHGRDLDDFLANAMISLETWHGDPGPDWDLGDLNRVDYDMVAELFTEFLSTTSEIDDVSPPDKLQ